MCGLCGDECNCDSLSQSGFISLRLGLVGQFVVALTIAVAEVFETVKDNVREKAP
jgi:hypothetical protein